MKSVICCRAVASNVGGKIVGLGVAAGLSASGVGAVAAPLGYFAGNVFVGFLVTKGEEYLYDRWGIK